ncbi:protein of unknown function [Burkholderia multivorans]
MPNPATKVRTTDTPKSKKHVQLQVLSFQALWNAYPKKDPYDDPTGQYENQCAIRMSVTFHNVGSDMKSFSQNVLKPMPGKKTLGRLILGGKATATRAYELAEWLRLRPFLAARQTRKHHRSGLARQDKRSNRYRLLLRLLATGWRLSRHTERRSHRSVEQRHAYTVLCIVLAVSPW